jgi:hypothetical protein
LELANRPVTAAEVRLNPTPLSIMNDVLADNCTNGQAKVKQQSTRHEGAQHTVNIIEVEACKVPASRFGVSASDVNYTKRKRLIYSK